MNIRNIFLVIAVAFGLFSGYGYVKAAAEKKQFKPEQTAEIEQIVKTIIERNPELVEAALRKSIENKEKLQLAAQKETVKKLTNVLFSNQADPFEGNNNAKYTLVAFVDPYCGYCKKMEGELKALLKTRNDIKIIYKPVAMISRESDAAAREMLAASKQGKFAPYQVALAEKSAGTVEERMAIAQAVGLDVTKLKADAESKEYKAILNANMQLGQQLQLGGVPAIVIKGGEVVNGYVGKEVLSKMIDSSTKAT